MNEQIIAFVVALLCSGALVTVYILWLAGLFSNRSKPQSVYDAIIMDAIVLKKVEEWLEQEVADNDAILKDDYLEDDDIAEGRLECVESLQRQIKQWRSEVDIRMIK